MATTSRTLIQREADDIDRQLFALASRATRLHEKIYHPPMDDLALAILRARGPARAMMHRDDREATKSRTDIAEPGGVAARPAFICPQCGKDTVILDQGHCPACTEANQRALDMHNAEYDHWSSLTDAQRRDEIRRSM